jgi:hypothetical protein
MAYLNQQDANGQSYTNGVNLVASSTLSGAQTILFNIAPALSGTSLSATYVNTANTTGVYMASSGAGTVAYDGAYAPSTAKGTVVYQAGATYTQSISAVTVTWGGTGYWGPDFTGATCTFSAPASGTNRTTGTPIVSAGSIIGVQITNTGSGYAVPGVATVTFSSPPTQYMYLHMKDRTNFKFAVPAGNANTSSAATLTPDGYTAVSKGHQRLRNQGQI